MHTLQTYTDYLFTMNIHEIPLLMETSTHAVLFTGKVLHEIYCSCVENDDEVDSTFNEDLDADDDNGHKLQNEYFGFCKSQESVNSEEENSGKSDEELVSIGNDVKNTNELDTNVCFLLFF